ncbi:MAG: PAS domain-containing protein [Alphaproteobacteria bacterium]|nr:PAS domain-containing protein [Alphaproteobacteria bacterium]
MTALSLDDYRHELSANPDFRRLFEYWLEGGQGRVPLRSQIDPLDFPQSLPRVAVIEKVDGPNGETFRYRLAGTEIVRRSGRDPTGKFFHELYRGDYLDEALVLYRSIAESGEPHWSRRRFPLSGAEGHLYYERLILPLSTDGGDADQFLLLIGVIEQDAHPDETGSFQIFR